MCMWYSWEDPCQEAMPVFPIVADHKIEQQRMNVPRSQVAKQARTLEILAQSAPTQALGKKPKPRPLYFTCCTQAATPRAGPITLANVAFEILRIVVGEDSPTKYYHTRAFLHKNTEQ